MSSQLSDDRLAGVLGRCGVRAGSPAELGRVEEASRVLLAAVRAEMTRRCGEFVGRIPDGAWKALFAALGPESRRAVVRSLGLPGDGHRRPSTTHQAHVVRLLRAGLRDGEDQAVAAARELTGPVLAGLVTAACDGVPPDGASPENAEVRAAAVALEPDHRPAVLPVLLTWLRDHDPAAFDLLVGTDAARAALASFWDRVTAPATASPADTARAAVDGALSACRVALAELEAGRVPPDGSIEALVRVRDVLREVADSLTGPVAGAVEPSLSAIEEAVERITVAAANAREIRRLLDAEVSGAASGALATAVASAESVLDRWPPATEEDRARAVLLGGVVRLATAAAADDPDVDASYERLRATAPAELVPLLTAALRGKLRFPAADAGPVPAGDAPEPLAPPEPAPPAVAGPPVAAGPPELVAVPEPTEPAVAGEPSARVPEAVPTAAPEASTVPEPAVSPDVASPSAASPEETAAPEPPVLTEPSRPTEAPQPSEPVAGPELAESSEPGAGPETPVLTEPAESPEPIESELVASSEPVGSAEPVESPEPAGLAEPVESPGPVELVESPEPVGSAELVEPVEPAGSAELREPVGSAAFVEPIESSGPVELAESRAPAEPAELVDPVESSGSAELVEPVEPAGSAELREPVGSAAFVEPVESSEAVESDLAEPLGSAESSGPVAAPEEQVPTEPAAPVEPAAAPELPLAAESLVLGESAGLDGSPVPRDSAEPAGSPEPGTERSPEPAEPPVATEPAGSPEPPAAASLETESSVDPVAAPDLPGAAQPPVPGESAEPPAPEESSGPTEQADPVVSESTVPESVVSESSGPTGQADPVVPESTVSEPAVPELIVSEPVVPELIVSEPVVPELIVSEPVVSEPTVPDPAVPDSAVPDSAVPDSAVPDSAGSEPVADVAAKAVAWLDRGEFALAHHLLAPRALGLAEAAAFAAVAAAVTGPDSAHAPELDAFVAVLDVDLLVDGDAARLLSTCAAMVAAVTTGNPVLGDLLVSLSDRMDAVASPLARRVGDGLRRGVLAGRGADALREVGAEDLEIVAAAGALRERLDLPRRIRLPRAAAVLARLRNTAAPGSLGAALHAAATDTRTGVRAVQDVLGRLTRTAVLERLIDDDDAAHGAPASPRITGSVRQEMLTTLRDDIAAAGLWARAVERHDRSASTRTDVRVEELRATLLAAHEAVVGLLASREDDPDPLVAAAARAARGLLADLARRVTGPARPRPVVVPDCPVLELPLLALPGHAWDGHVLPPEPSRDLTADLLALPDTGVDLAATALAKAEADDFRTAAYLAAQLPEPRRAELLAQVADHRAARVDHVREQLRGMRRQLARAGVAGLDPDGPVPSAPVAFDAVTEELLTELLDDALSALREPDADLRSVTQARDAVRDRIGELRREETRRLEQRLADLADEGPDTEIARVREHLAAGRLDLAEDDLDHIAGGDPLFRGYRDEHFETFFPAGVEALPDGIDSALLGAIRTGGRHPALAGVDLPDRLRDEVANGLELWAGLRPAFAQGWKSHLAADNLLPALRLIGLDVRPHGIDPLTGAHTFSEYARGRRYLEIRGASLTGKALVPVFGSAAQGRYRLLIVWNQPTAAELDEWRESDNTSFLPLIICYLGTLSTEDRSRLARLWSDPSRRATVVLDDALLTWVAVRRGRFDEFMRLSLPFTAVQPFLAEKRADIPAEMFYGREQEKGRLLQPGNAPSIVYGGRGMGKSALMYRIANDAEDTDLVVVWFEVDKVPGIHDQPDLLWTDLEQRLADKGVGRRSPSNRSNAREAVARAVRRWVEENPGRRLLLLLDEAEGFVDGDAPTFAHVRRLLDLGTSTDSRCQVVFAGLHSVQHYSVGNSPLSPTGHLRIGPLASQHAYDLLTRPLAALGYRLTDSDAQRVLLHCNYQPYLIQLVAEKLLARRFAARAAGREQAPPPWPIPAAAVAEVLADADSRRDLRAALGLTLDLDKRTRVIANVLARHAYRNPRGARMADLDLFDECRSAWPHGFAETGADAFRQLLDELVGLGVLAEADERAAGRAIRNETVLRALGARDEVEQSLRRLPESALPMRQAREFQRPVRPGQVRRSPLVNAQHAQLFAKGNRARVLVGSEATGIDQVVAALRETRPAGVDLAVVDPHTIGEYRARLETGATAAQRYLVLGDLTTGADGPACRRALALALGDESGAGLPRDRAASRTVALVAGVPNIGWLLELAATPGYEQHLMPLRRYDGYTLPLRWQADPVLGDVADGDLAVRALDLTGGWPVLVESLAEEVLAAGPTSPLALAEALDRLEQAQADPGWCAGFLRRSGADFAEWPDHRPLADTLAEYAGPCAPADLATLTGRTLDEVEVFARVARWLGLVDTTPAGELILAPLIAHCARTAGQPGDGAAPDVVGAVGRPG